MPRGNGSFNLLQCIRGNANNIELPREYEILATFNADLFPYHEEENEEQVSR